MQVLDHQPNTWFLFQVGDTLLLDAACNHSAFGYSWLIELNAEERLAYERGGRAFLDWLAQDIHNGVPILNVSTSRYKARNRGVEYANDTSKAVEAWRAGLTQSCKYP